MISFIQEQFSALKTKIVNRVIIVNSITVLFKKLSSPLLPPHAYPHLGLPILGINTFALEAMHGMNEAFRARQKVVLEDWQTLLSCHLHARLVFRLGEPRPLAEQQQLDQMQKEDQFNVFVHMQLQK